MSRKHMIMMMVTKTMIMLSLRSMIRLLVADAAAPVVSGGENSAAVADDDDDDSNDEKVSRLFISSAI